MRSSSRLAPAAKATPSAPPATASMRLSVSNWRTSRALSAQCLPHGKLARPGRGARQQQVGDVGAGDQQDQADDAHQDLQRIGERRGGREAGRDRRQRNMCP